MRQLWGYELNYTKYQLDQEQEQVGAITVTEKFTFEQSPKYRTKAHSVSVYLRLECYTTMAYNYAVISYMLTWTCLLTATKCLCHVQYSN